MWLQAGDPYNEYLRIREQHQAGDPYYEYLRIREQLWTTLRNGLQ